VFALPAICALIILIYARPQEFFEALQAAPLLYVFFALALFGIALDLRVGNTRLRATPQLPWVGCLALWSFAGVLVRSPRAALKPMTELAICIALYLVIAHGLQTLRGLHAVAAVVLAMVVFVSGVGAQQGFAATGCILVDESTPGDATTGKRDGRPCTTERDCYLGDPEPGAQYLWNALAFGARRRSARGACGTGACFRTRTSSLSPAESVCRWRWRSDRRGVELFGTSSWRPSRSPSC